MDYMLKFFRDFVLVYYEEFYKIFSMVSDIFIIKEIRIEGYMDFDDSYYNNLKLFVLRVGKIQDYIRYDIIFMVYF